MTQTKGIVDIVLIGNKTDSTQSTVFKRNRKGLKIGGEGGGNQNGSEGCIVCEERFQRKAR